jgi:hypothetical protein
MISGIRSSAALVAVIVVAALVASPGASATQAAPAYFPLRLGGSAGPLRLGMTLRAARAFLHSPRYKASGGRVGCAQYDMQVGKRRGLVGACFDPARGLIAFSVNGPVFCFERSVCANGSDRIPFRLRRGFTRYLDQQNGVYHSYLRKQLRGRPYQVVLEGPATDPAWSMRAMGFGPCKASSMVRYYAPVRC